MRHQVPSALVGKIEKVLVHRLLLFLDHALGGGDFQELAQLALGYLFGSLLDAE